MSDETVSRYLPTTFQWLLAHPLSPPPSLEIRNLTPPVAHIGCICPPGANVACERADCPRKGLPK